MRYASMQSGNRRPSDSALTTPRSRSGPHQSFQALKPLVSPLTNGGLPNGRANKGAFEGKANVGVGGGNNGGGGGKPIMEWLSRKLGHGKKPLTAGATMAGRPLPTVAVTGTPPSGTTLSSETAITPHPLPTPKAKSPATSFVRQASSLGISASRRKQTVVNNTLEVPNRRRRSSHHPSSIKSASVRSSRAPLFSPPRSSVARYPRAATFMTRSSMSPASSFISSRRSRRSSSAETEHSLASSYLDVNDPDSRSFVPSADADEDASLRPFPPSLHPSSPHRRASSIVSFSSPNRWASSIASGAYSQNSPPRGNRIDHDMSTRNVPGDREPLPSGFPLRRSSDSTMATQSSLGAHSRTWTSDQSRGTRSVDTRPTTILSSLDLPRVAHIAQVPPPRVVPHHWDHHRPPFAMLGGGSSLAASPSILDAPSLSSQRRAGQIHRTMTWDSGLSASPSVSSPLATAIFPFPSTMDMRNDSRLNDNVRHAPQQFQSSILTPVQTERNAEDHEGRSTYPSHVPHHSHPHPRDNPRPLSPPSENASVLTLASSTFTDANRAAERHHSRSAMGPTTTAYGVTGQTRRPLSGDYLAPPIHSAIGRDHMPTLTDHTYPTELDNEDEPDAYNRHQTPVMLSSYNERDGSFRFEYHRPLSFFDRASSYYFNPGGGGAGSVRASVSGAGTMDGGRRMSLRSTDDRAGWAVDDRASVTAMRRRGSWESGESSFSWAGAGGGNIPTPTIGAMTTPIPMSLATPIPPARDSFFSETPLYLGEHNVVGEGAVRAASVRSDRDDDGGAAFAIGLAHSLDELSVHEGTAGADAAMEMPKNEKKMRVSTAVG
ncbi:hypothetical protein QFC22_004858 [Naganishia vaughanmartiniae]|uniref:Uncharacterized protein n=1 Tax=Naganishia vaughanmartiniae TaxID=1424756 RepID=A0ACC2WZ46_9TREE|nr:hypothetical protein QFC22_004858 [Naganishia vaughanmartiniae]